MTLMSVAAIYSRVLAEGGLQHTLATIDQSILNVRIIVQNRPLGPADYDGLRSRIEGIAENRLGFLLRDIQRLGQTQSNLPMVFKPDGLPPRPSSVMGRPFFLTEFPDHSRIIDGRWPRTTPVLHAKGLDMEAAVGESAALPLDIEVGTRILLTPFSSDPQEGIAVTIVGLIEAIDPQAEYWMGSPAYFNLQQFGDDEVLPLYVPEEHFFGGNGAGLGARYPSLVGDFGWFAFLDIGRLNAGAAGPTMDALVGLETDINRQFPRTLVFTGLKLKLQQYQRALTLARVPIFLFISLVVMVILYFLALIPGLAARASADEAGLLRSRGGGVAQVSGLLVLGEGIVALLAMAVGPFLAWAIVRYLLLGTINPAGGGADSVPVEISASMFWMGAVGGVLSLLVLALSGWRRAHAGMVESLSARARPPMVPFVHRYYLDLLILAALGLVLWQIQGRGGFAFQDLTSRALEVDYTLLLGPILGLLAVTAITLRVLPWLGGALARLAYRFSSAWVALPLVRLSRDPLPHGSLVVILMLAAALGVFGAAFQSSLSRSQIHQALYRVGGDLVLTKRALGEDYIEGIASIPGVQGVSPIVREEATLLNFPGAPLTLLAANPETLPDAIWFRDDFAGKDLKEVFRPLRRGNYISAPASGGPGSGIVIPESARKIGLWVSLDGLDQTAIQPPMNLWVRVEGTGGRSHHLLLGDLLSPGSNPGGPDFAQMGSEAGAQAAPVGLEQVSPGGSKPHWEYFEAPLETAVGPLKPPIRMTALFMSRPMFSRTPPGSIFLDDITVVSEPVAGTGVVPGVVPAVLIEGFENLGGWATLPHLGGVPDLLEHSAQAARSGRLGLSFTWEEAFSGFPRGIFVPAGGYPLPAIGGPTFHVGQEVKAKIGAQIVPVAVQDVVSYFPTVDTSSRSLLVVSLDDYSQYLKRIPRGNFEAPNHLWVGINDEANRGQVIRAIKTRQKGGLRLVDRDEIADLARRNPLAGGGWNGLTLLAMASITVAVVLTLAVHAVAAMRTNRVDLAVARALGLTRIQLVASLALERVLVAFLGIGVGSAVGVWMGRWVLGFLDITPGGSSIVPPMIPTVQTWLAVSVIAGLIAATLFALLFAYVAAQRLRIPDTLRIGQ